MATITPSVLFPVLESLPSQLASAFTSRGPGRHHLNLEEPQRLINQPMADGLLCTCLTWFHLCLYPLQPQWYFQTQGCSFPGPSYYGHFE